MFDSLKNMKPASQEIRGRCRQFIADHAAWCQQVTGDCSDCPCLFGDILDAIPAAALNKDGFVHRVSQLEYNVLFVAGESRIKVGIRAE